MDDERWPAQDRRCDGLTIKPGIEGLIIMPTSGLPVSECPCCGLPFDKTQQARLVADILFPINDPEGGTRCQGQSS